MSVIKNIAKQILPGFMLSSFKKSSDPSDNSFTGNYLTWAEAQNDSEGYDQQQILEKVKDASLKVKNGKAAYERDSVSFDKIEYSWQLLAALLRIASMNNNTLSVLDFGGSLGTTYFQNRGFLSSLSKLEWNIVEQPNFASYGKKFFEDDILKFYSSLDECIQNKIPQVIILSAVLQYLENPFVLIQKIKESGINHIIIDKTIFIQDDRDRIMIQHVPENIYKASYPVRFFNEEKFVAAFKESFNLLSEFNCYEEYKLTFNGLKASYKGFIFERKNQILT